MLNDPEPVLGLWLIGYVHVGLMLQQIDSNGYTARSLQNL